MLREGGYDLPAWEGRDEGYEEVEEIDSDKWFMATNKYLLSGEYVGPYIFASRDPIAFPVPPFYFPSSRFHSHILTIILAGILISAHVDG
jgi:hypothetical protein